MKFNKLNGILHQLFAISILVFSFSLNIQAQCEATVGIELDEENIEIVPFNADSCTIIIPYTLTNSGTCDIGMFAIDITVAIEPFGTDTQIDTIMGGITNMTADMHTVNFTTDLLMDAGMCLDTMFVKWILNISTETPPLALTEIIACPSGTGTMEVCSNDNSIICNLFDGCVVPISLSNFEGRVEGDDAYLEWETLSEIDNRYFIVEHSNDGKTFSELGKVEGAGNSSQLNHYEFLHLNMPSGTNYYRLTQVDYNGNSTMSDVIMLQNKVQKFTIHPNPSTDILKISFSEASMSSSQLLVYDLKGKIICQNILPENLLKYDLFVDYLDPGVYILQVVKNGEIINKRFVKI